MNIEALIEKLKKYNWDETNVRIALRAECKCEYCKKDLLESIDNYKLWQIDHIIPKNSGNENCEDFDNKALSCTQCNKDFKGKWNPISVIGEGRERQEYIEQVIKYIEEKKEKKKKQLDKIRDIFRSYFNDNKMSI